MHVVLVKERKCENKINNNSGADWRRGRVVDSGPRGPGFNPQPGRLSLWP